MVNVATNTAAMFFFILQKHPLMAGIILAVCNILGSFAGTALAIKYGSGFIRIFFLILLIFLIGRMGYDLFFTLKMYDLI